MKTFSLTTLISLILLFCTIGIQAQSDQLTQQQKDQIKNETKAVLDSVISKWQRLDGQGALQYYASDIVQVSSDGSRCDSIDYKKKWIEGCNSATSISAIPTRVDFKVVSYDVVISTWVGKCKFLFKSGEIWDVDALVYTDVYKKIGNQWKIVYEHVSSN
jgi:ketosteroid isomerase-like protein